VYKIFGTLPAGETMPQTNPVKLLLNQESSTDKAVDSPAFSLTKVMATAALVLTPVTTYLVKKIGDVNFSSWQVVVLIAAVLAFLAVTAAADVLARSLATFGTSSQSFVPIDPGWTAKHLKTDEDVMVTVIAARRIGDGGEFLIVEDDKMSWVRRTELKVGG
jgi:hypothetical protein